MVPTEGRPLSLESREGTGRLSVGVAMENQGGGAWDEGSGPPNLCFASNM